MKMDSTKQFTVLYCIGTLSAQGGTERMLSSKASTFAEKYNIQVHIVTIGADTSRFYKFSDDIIFHSLYQSDTDKSFPKVPILSNYLIKKDLYQRYEKLIKKIKPNIVIVLASGTDDFYIPKICRKLSIPVAREFHCSKGAVYAMANLIPSWPSRCWYFIQKWRVFKAFDKYDYLLLLTKKDQANGNYKTKSVVIPNFVPDVVSENMLADVINNRIFISAGSMRDGGKGFDTIIKAWSKIHHKYPNWSFEIYGDGPYRKVLERLIDELNVSTSVKLCGVTNDMPSKYRKSAFFVFASIGEGLPMVLIEAMRYGLPCVSLDCQAGPSDIITDGEDGFLVRMNDVEGLTKCIETEISSTELRIEQAKCARLKSMKFSEEEVIPQWLTFFGEFGYKG